MELTLKATVIGFDTAQTMQVIRFAKAHNYMLTVDYQTVESAVYATFTDQAMEKDYKLIQVLIESELTYQIEKKLIDSQK